MITAFKFRDEFNAILIGEPAGNKPNHYGEQRRFSLPNSKLAVGYSTKHFHQINNADPPTLAPDIFVPYSLNDFLSGRDPALKAAVDHPLR